LTLVCASLAWGCGDDGAPTTGGGTETTGTDGTTTNNPSSTSNPSTTQPTTGDTEGSSSTTDEPTTNPPTTTTMPDTDPSTTDESTSSSSSSSSSGTTMGVDESSSTTGEPVCETVLCGVAEVCCAVGEECVLDNCLPACDSGIRCGAAQDVCCDNGQVCLEDECVDPLGPCGDSYDCDEDQFCESTLGQCLPQFEPVACEFVPVFDELALMLEWSYEAEEVIAVPAIADIDGDEVNEVVISRVGLNGPGTWQAGGIAVLDGQTGDVEWQINHAPLSGDHGSYGRSTLGVTDVSGDGLPDIIYAGRRTSNLSPIRAVDGFGNNLWVSHDAAGVEYRLDVENGAPSFANFDSDPEAEIVFGASALDNDGLVVWDQDGSGIGATYGSPTVYRGGISAIANLNATVIPEVISGRHAWALSWNDAVSPPAVSASLFWDANTFATTPDGYPAVADLDQDGNPEIVLVASGTIRVLEGNTGRLWCGIDPDQGDCFNAAFRTQPYTLPDADGGGPGLGGPPTIADFDGDGRPEVGVAGASSYTVFDFNRDGETVVVQPGFPAPDPGEIYPRWTRETQDQSSNATGSSVFDFQGDGAAEVIYADECYLRVYDGSNGDILLEEESSSATIHEYPLVVDVDTDGNSEIVVVNNLSDANCDAIAGYNYKQGVFVYGDANDQWVPTRRVWTQHAYHVTNVTSDGNTPASESNNWTEAGLNNYRQNVQGSGVFNAPDLTVDLTASLASCEREMLDIVATVRNSGNLGVGSGIEVRLYNGLDDTGVFIGSQSTTTTLLPGATEQVVWQFPFEQGDPTMDFFVTVDGDDAAAGVVTECVEDNNGDTLPAAQCIFPG
jgi:hypothetical protein